MVLPFGAIAACKVAPPTTGADTKTSFFDIDVTAFQGRFHKNYLAVLGLSRANIAPKHLDDFRYDAFNLGMVVVLSITLHPRGSQSIL